MALHLEFDAMHVLKQFLSLILLTTLVIPPQLAWSWGAEGHMYVNRVAALKMPAEMPLFLRTSVAEITYLGPEPDRWRGTSEFALKNAQEPDHFIDLERVDWLDPLPRGRYEFYRKLYEKRAMAGDQADEYLPERVGLQPYIVMEIYGRLVVAFHQYRELRKEDKPTAPAERSAIFYSGWLGHYVADGAQPLHTTIQYNGWIGANPNGYATEHGIHALFESTFVAKNITTQDFARFVHPPEHITDPFAQYIEYLKQSNKLVEKVYSLDKGHGFKGKGTPDAFEFTTQRLAAGSQMLLNLWYSAWLDSASYTETPPLPQKPHSP
jgi:hypothetical protein